MAGKHNPVNPRPLAVDLDGTLVKSDTLVDSVLVLARYHPAALAGLPGALLKGKAALKAFVGQRVELDVAHLPYNRPLLKWLEQEHGEGRNIYLATGADRSVAARVAAHCGLFVGLLSSDGVTNLTGNRKMEALRAQLGEGPFDYIGNDTPDLPMLAQATEPMVANPTAKLRLAMRSRGISATRHFNDRRTGLRLLIKTLRVHQWAKNLLIFIPLLLSHALHTGGLMRALAAFCCFSLAASSAYIVNDMLDIEADRRHVHKRQRPFAAGDLGAVQGFLLALLLLASALVGGWFLPGRFHLWLLGYLATTFAYTWLLKRLALVDVLTLSGLYILRLQAGGAATMTPISHWLSGFSLFLFLSLAIVKRFAELENLRLSGKLPSNGRGYMLVDAEQLRAFGTASAYAAVVVLAIYISGPDVTRLYVQPRLLWMLVPLMLLWLNRVWLLAARGELDEDPVAFALKDNPSRLIGLAVLVIAMLAALLH